MEEQKSTFRYLVLVLVFLNMLFIMIAVNCVPPLFTEIVEQIPLSKAQMGSIMGVVTLASLFLAPIGGAIADKIGCRWTLGGSCLIVVISGGLRAFAVSPFQFIGLMFIFGIGAALFSPAVPKALGMWFPSNELARANGIVFTSMGIGAAIAMATATSFMSPNFGGWSGTMLVLGGISLVMAILWMIFYRDQKVGATLIRKKSLCWKTLRRYLR
jgi:MFS family permease